MQNGKKVGKPGMTGSELEANFEQFDASAMDDNAGWYDVSLGYETQDHAEGRAIAAVNELKARASKLERDETVVIVCHFDMIDLLLRQCVGGVPSVAVARSGKVFQSYNCAMHVVDIASGEGEVPRILFTNRHDYMGDLVRRDQLGIV